MKNITFDTFDWRVKKLFQWVGDGEVIHSIIGFSKVPVIFEQIADEHGTVRIHAVETLYGLYLDFYFISFRFMWLLKNKTAQE